MSEADELSQSQTIFHLSIYVERHQFSQYGTTINFLCFSSPPYHSISLTLSSCHTYHELHISRKQNQPRGWNELHDPLKEVLSPSEVSEALPRYYLQGFCGIVAHMMRCVVFFFFFLIATKFNCILVVSIIHTQFITA